MKKLNWIVSIVVLLSMLLAAVGYAQYADPWYTAYQVVNMGDGPAVIVVDYYDSNGVKQTTAQKTFNNVPANGSILVLQFSDDPNLGTGRYSAVITADQPIAAVANQQLNPTGSATYAPIPPFSSYSGQGGGGSQVTLPAVMYNWYGYYTEIFIMNVGAGDASNVDITYIPGELDGEATGAAGQTDLNNSIKKYASLQKSQQAMANLGAPSGTHTGRFLGSAIITADQPIIAVVNQHNPDASKLMTYNGFTGGAQTIYAPSYMRGYNNYYTTLLVANPSAAQTAHVQITYTPDTSVAGRNVAAAGSTVGTVVVSHSIAPQTSLTRYDGPPATDEQSDLDDHDVTGHAYVSFYGAVKVTSDIDVMVMVNVEARKKRPDGSPAPGQAGSYNGIANTEASDVIVAPVILSSYYKYYTTLLVQNTTGTAGSCDVTYTSDGVSSSVKNHSETYTHVLPANGSFTVYEGEPGGVTSGDINTDPAWMSAGKRRFIGSAIIDCTQPVVAFVNEEKGVPGLDSMYTMNTFSK